MIQTNKGVNTNEEILVLKKEKIAHKGGVKEVLEESYATALDSPD